MTVKKLLGGFGYGNAASTISIGDEDAEIVEIIDEAVHSPDVLVPISIDEATGQPIQDDGCGDGRMPSKVYPHPHRPKVFGGGATMVLSMLIGNDDTENNTPEALFLHTIKRLNDKQIDFGAHSDDHADNMHCGCGAIDRLPEVLAASVTYRQQLAASIEVLGIDTKGLDNVLDHFRVYAQMHARDPYNGHVVSEAIVREGKIVKELTGAHIEKAIVLNTVPGQTVHQAFVHEQTKGQGDVFATDVWRLQQLAGRLYDTPEKRHSALLSELIYTLATAAVLTRGNLPVYLVSN